MVYPPITLHQGTLLLLSHRYLNLLLSYYPNNWSTSSDQLPPLFTELLTSLTCMLRISSTALWAHLHVPLTAQSVSTCKKVLNDSMVPAGIAQSLLVLQSWWHTGNFRSCWAVGHHSQCPPTLRRCSDSCRCARCVSSSVVITKSFEQCHPLLECFFWLHFICLSLPSNCWPTIPLFIFMSTCLSSPHIPHNLSLLWLSFLALLLFSLPICLDHLPPHPHLNRAL